MTIHSSFIWIFYYLYDNTLLGLLLIMFLSNYSLSTFDGEKKLWFQCSQQIFAFDFLYNYENTNAAWWTFFIGVVIFHGGVDMLQVMFPRLFGLYFNWLIMCFISGTLLGRRRPCPLGSTGTLSMPLKICRNYL